jgi:hypothetical protein
MGVAIRSLSLQMRRRQGAQYTPSTFLRHIPALVSYWLPSLKLKIRKSTARGPLATALLAHQNRRPFFALTLKPFLHFIEPAGPLK